MKIDLILSGLVAQKHTFTLPLDYHKPDGDTIEVFVRELVAADKQDQDLPYLVYFQGGPGFGAVRPMANGGWIKRALQQYRVLLLDQRGTGLSSPISAVSLAHLTANEQAEYLTHFRADNIIRDAEAIRAQFSPFNTWSIIGQSFGGFCVLRYLTAAPEGLTQAFITGGLPSLTRPADEVYQATYKRVLAKNNDFFSRFSDAQALVTALAKHITDHDTYLATGEKLTVEMLQLLGVNLGMEEGPEAVYYLLEQALITIQQGTATRTQVNPLFLAQFCQFLDYNTNPIFALLHESIYCQQQASAWAAHHVRADYTEFNYQAGQPFLFTGEMIYPWMFEQFNNLKPLQAAAQLLAEKPDWSVLYDLEVLKNNQVPVAAAIYSEDMYVEMQYSLETASCINNLKYWLTSEFEHNGIRMDGDKVLSKLIDLNQGVQLR